MWKYLIIFLAALPFFLPSQAQPVNCTFKPPFYIIHFGRGNVSDINTGGLSNYDRVPNSCPTDGHYTYTSYTSNCFRGDWFTLDEDHTPAMHPAI